jgi:type III restriction enzyme
MTATTTTNDGKIDRLIINGPYDEPTHHWGFDPQKEAFEKREGRRPAGFVRSSGTGSLDDPGIFVSFELPNRIRLRVSDWRDRDYPNATGVSRRLLKHWRDRDQRQFPFFFCQIEAIETLIWWAEASPADKHGIEIPGDGGAFERVCSKMATGTGKTLVMSMLIAWQVLNKVANPQDTRYAKNILIVGPGLTVKQRLQVLKPSDPSNYYDLFNIIPDGMRTLINQAKVEVENRHALEPIDPNAGPKVVKKGPEGPEAFCRRVLRDLGSSKNILVINDEGHHAWRVTNDDALDKDDREIATQWVSSLDLIHLARGILRCHDFSATPFVPRGKNATEALVFPWIVSDFGLNDAIESGLVKTPRVVVREDALPNAKTLKPKLYHIYSDKDVFDDLNRKSARLDEPLPDLVTNAYHLLGADWLETKKSWEAAGMPTRPVMISVTNKTQTAARVASAFALKRIPIDPLCDPTRLLHIDSNVLKIAEEQENVQVLAPVGDGDDEEAAPKLNKAQQAEALRQQVDTVGQVGKPGEKIQNVISVLMLSEGWDTRTVTHIMGLRAFTSQLLCEQVVGRGLRRASYGDFDENGFLKAEYVNVFGVPFRFLPVEGQEGAPPSPPIATKRVEAMPDKAQYAISWPNVIRVDHIFKHDLELDMTKVDSLVLDAMKSTMLVSMAPIVDGQPNLDGIAEIDLKKLASEYRLQKIAFVAARDIFNQERRPDWKGNEVMLMSRIADITQRFVESDRIRIEPPLFAADPLKRRVLIALNLTRVVHHLWKHLVPQNTTEYELIFDDRLPIRGTGDMNPWYTSKPCYPTKRSHLNLAVSDSGWEGTTSYMLDQDDERVEAWVKNDHLGFEMSYVYRGGIYTYRPDFLVKLRNGVMLVLEVKGQDDEKNKAKRDALKEWVNAVNGDGRFGEWVSDVIFEPEDVLAVLGRHCAQVAV